MNPILQYSQNFLHDSRLIDSLIDNTSINMSDTVIEIGAGTGIITQALAKKCKKLISYEFDSKLCTQLTIMMRNQPNTTINNQDFLTVQLPQSKYKVFANPPFQIISAICDKLFFQQRTPAAAYLIVQKEYAKKLLGRSYATRNSLQSIMLRSWTQVSVVHIFKRSDFIPRPRVDTVLLSVRKLTAPLVPYNQHNTFFDFVTYMFSQTNPTVHLSLQSLVGSDKSESLMNRMTSSFDRKPSQLDFEDWLYLFNQLVRDPQIMSHIAGSYQKLKRQQLQLRKIHRTRTDPYWKLKYSKF